MMFNKILVLADEGVKIQDYESLAKYVFKNLDPATDIYFSQGPMDVLDHSCSKMGFGGKMCLDGTAKFEEEQSGLEFGGANLEIGETAVKARFNEVHAVNTTLLVKEIPVLLVSVEKERRGHVRELHRQLCASGLVAGVKMILYVEHKVDAKDLPVALWRFCNNLDPRRDSFLYENTASDANHQTPSCMGLDGTIKTKELDNFDRDWPNIIVMDNATIEAVDAKWSRVGLGAVLLSPSLKFKGQIYGEEAVATS
jgi:4-hydroxy-3-polyprenylbenzoate decarboxylase